MRVHDNVSWCEVMVCKDKCLRCRRSLSLGHSTFSAAAFFAFRIETKLSQNLMKNVTASGLDLAGSPYLSSSQNDRHAPLVREPAIAEVIDLRSFMK